MGPYTVDRAPARYELVGMVVHTGQASAGHYYSYIKDRRGSTITNTSYGKWFKFNDTTVEEFNMTEEAMATECFGGRYKVTTSEYSKYTNMLFNFCNVSPFSLCLNNNLQLLNMERGGQC